ncbi:MAG: N-acetylneuraminate synthase family protein, partial [Lachnospiraceae bacterium]|nr:N-acetylneuraminate synthase family protein [Lachnospiraceae bacterium]
MNLYNKIKNGVYIIAEMSANHGGRIENAFRIIEEAKKAGADCVKIQTYTADTLTIPCDKEPFKITDGLWKDYTYYDLYK